MKRATISLRWITLLLVATMFTGCAKSLVYWQQAVRSLEKGAEMEMRNRFAERPDMPEDTPAAAVPDIDELVEGPNVEVDERPTAQQFYQQADQKIDQALAQPAPLQKEDVLGNALTIKALTSWKTGQPEAARKHAADALQALERAGEGSPRDRALATAVPGLVSLDIAYDSTRAMVEKLKVLSDAAPNASRAENQAFLNEGERLYRKFVLDVDSELSIAGALNTLQAAAMTTTENEDIRRFLLLCELTGLKNRFDFWAQLNNFARRSRIKADDEGLRTWLDAEELDYINDKDAALERLAAILDGTDHPVYRFWDRLL